MTTLSRSSVIRKWRLTVRRMNAEQTHHSACVQACWSEMQRITPTQQTSMEQYMIGRRIIVAGALTLGALLVPQALTAAPLSPVDGNSVSSGNPVVTVHYGRCSYWRRECAERWGWGTWRWRRCLGRHDCG
jgi:hypothetical protein